MQGESEQTFRTANFIWDNGNLSVSPPYRGIITLLTPYVSTALLLKQNTKDYVQRPLKIKWVNIESQLCLKGKMLFSHGAFRTQTLT